MSATIAGVLASPMKTGRNRPGTANRNADEKIDLGRVATISIDGQVLPLHSWGMNGFRCGNYKGILRAGKKTAVRLIIPTGDGPQSFNMMAEIDERDIAAGTLSGTFVGVSSLQIERINELFAARLAGRRPSDTR